MRINWGFPSDRPFGISSWPPKCSTPMTCEAAWSISLIPDAPVPGVALAAGEHIITRMWQIGLKTRLFGKVDQVPGVCHVATEFFHIAFLPVVPMRSWLVIAGTETDVLIYESYEAMPIPRNWKSVAFAW